jgi:hypothetical protein
MKRNPEIFFIRTNVLIEAASGLSMVAEEPSYSGSMGYNLPSVMVQEGNGN